LGCFWFFVFGECFGGLGGGGGGGGGGGVVLGFSMRCNKLQRNAYFQPSLCARIYITDSGVGDLQSSLGSY